MMYRYALNSKKIRNDLKVETNNKNLKNGLKETFNWYLNNNKFFIFFFKKKNF